MKAMYCELCGFIVSPGRGNFNPSYCLCRSHRCWWVDGGAGVFRVQHLTGHPSIPRPVPGAPWNGEPEVWILGISNSFLHHRSEGTPNAEDIQAMLAATPSSYIFKKTMSNIIRIRPGQSGDTDWGVLEDTPWANSSEATIIKKAADKVRREELERVIHFMTTAPAGSVFDDLIRQLAAEKHREGPGPL